MSSVQRGTKVEAGSQWVATTIIQARSEDGLDRDDHQRVLDILKRWSQDLLTAWLWSVQKKRRSRMKKSWRSRCSVPWHGLSCGQVLITDQLLNIPVEMMDGQADM